MVLLNPEGRVERAAPVARQWLRDIAGLEIVPGAALPAPLAGLLARSATGRAWLSGPGGQLNVRQSPRPGGDLIVVEGPRAGGRSESFRAAGLTAREAEVLDWLCEGKTNAEIALITQAAPATVKKHLENIYAKLGVENRGAAARLAQDIAGD